MKQLFDVPAAPMIPLLGEDAGVPVRRIFCVGRNYEAHARELGNTVQRDAPIWFTKTPSAYCPSGAAIPYPPGTANCHYEMELVVALGTPGFRVEPQDALDLVLGYACGLDMTRRDLQGAAREKGLPWDTGKDFENSAVIGPFTRAARFGEPGAQRITLALDGETRQDAVLSDMIWPVRDLIAHISTLYHLEPGDLIFTGTPAGVGPVAPGNRLSGAIDGLAPVTLEITAPE
ncbi:fumarylacetoacetase [Novosphingobium sp. PC22D]|uniref:fumarylacetoacetate hydrolase family protein n=1 Tax=Novosphingobium sp. PC22D TaxID=1962403 RepID=UPI000BEF9F99|nr:fumarylacetoacetate hydrolase family protein [Novosphingobium sp. PC22D]PEQ14740.1 fumarylacetoacetase [Novosphingobium sp. PC22D]